MELGPPLEGGGGGGGIRSEEFCYCSRSSPPSWNSIILTKAAAAVESSSKCQKSYPVLYGYNMWLVMKNKMFDLIGLQKKNVWLYVSLEKKSLPFDAGRNKMFAHGRKNLAPPWISNGPPLTILWISLIIRQWSPWLCFHCFAVICWATLRKKATIHQVTTMLATSKNVLFPGHNHLLTIGTDDPSS